MAEVSTAKQTPSGNKQSGPGAVEVGNISLVFVGLCILTFMGQLALTTYSLSLDVSVVWQQPWRLITAVFAHADISHLLLNMFALGLFGLILEGRIGSKKVMWLFLLSGVGINLFVAIFNIYPISLGASGAIFAILGALIVLRPTMMICAYNMPLPMALAGALWAAQDVFGVFFPTEIASIAHLAGLAIGILAGVYWRKQYGDKYEKRKKDPQLDKELDAWEKNNMPVIK